MPDIQLRPSGCGVWCGGGCTPAPHVETLYPPELPSEITAEGSALHEVMRTESLNPDGPRLRELVDTTVTVWDEATNEETVVLLTFDLLAVAQVAVDHVLADRQRLETTGYEYIEWIEEPVQMDGIYPGYKGTLDRAVWVPTTRTLYVDDYKFGYTEVIPDENYQFISYAAGLIETHNISPDNIIARVIQPRSRVGLKVKSWETSLFVLEREYFPVIRVSATEVMEGSQVRRPGTHCRYCPGKLECNAFHDMGSTLYQSFMLIPDDQRDIDIVRLEEFSARLLEYAKTLDKSVRARMEFDLTTGKHIPGWGMKPGKGTWGFRKNLDSSDLDGLRLAGLMFDVSVLTEKPKTPTQLRNAGIDLEKLGLIGLTERRTGSMKLTPVDEQQELDKIFGEY
jgi:hypothetical protein